MNPAFLVIAVGVRPGSWAKTGAAVASMPAAIIAAFAKLGVLDIDYSVAFQGNFSSCCTRISPLRSKMAWGEGSSLQRGELLHAITTIYVDGGAGDVRGFSRG